jgi:hypothetical protein
MNPPFEIGQKIYVPWASAYLCEMVQCPICFGKKSVTLILGNGEHVPVECEGCGLGYNGPQGTIQARAPASGVRDEIISGMTLRGGEWIFEVGHERINSRDIFTDLALAEAKRAELHAEAEARYHREQIARCEQTLAWHKAKLSVAKSPIPRADIVNESNAPSITP